MTAPLSILLVEDNPDDCFIMEQLVIEKNLPYRLQTVSTLSQARQKLGQTTFDVFLLDYQLPDGDCFSLLPEIRETPAIIISGAGSEHVAVQAMHMGAYDYIIKSPDNSHLALLPSVIDNILKRKRAEIGLIKSEQRYKTIVETVPDIIFQLNADRVITYANPSVQTLGYTPSEVIGRHIEDFVCMKDKTELFHLATKRHGDRATKGLEICFKNRNGSLRWEEMKVSVLNIDSFGLWDETKFNGDKFVGTQCVAWDITDRKKAEIALLHSKEEMQSILANAMDGIITISENGIIELFNPAAERIFGYQTDELVGKNINLLMPEPDRSRHDSYIQNYLRTGETKILGRAREVSAMRKNGEVFPIELSSSEVTRKKSADKAALEPFGNASAGRKFIGIVRDVTERKRVEEELRQYRENLKELVETRTHQLTVENMNRRQVEESLARALCEQNTIFSANPDIIYVTDLQARLLKWNVSLETATGYSPEELMGKTCDSLVPPHEANLVNNAFARMLGTGKAEVEIHLLCKSGALTPYHFNGVPLRNERGEMIGCTGTGRDITERKQAEKQLKKVYEQLIHSEKLSALGKLTGSIAHEFNNPLYGIKNIVEQTRDEVGLSKEIKYLLGLAVRECDRLAGLVRKLQGFYRPSDDARVLVDVHQLLKDIEALARKNLQVKGIEIVKHYSPNLPKIFVVEDQIRQVLLNLLNNAEEAISSASGKITVSTEIAGPDIKVHVQDTGEGIPEENMKRLFEPFFSTKGLKGTGLGLSVCHGIVKAHGGEIEVASKPGDGAMFTLILPAHGQVACAK